MFKKYYHPTPKKWRKIGDSILIFGTTISTFILLEYDKVVQIYTPNEIRYAVAITVVLTAIGKSASNLFSDDSNVNTTEEKKQ